MDAFAKMDIFFLVTTIAVIVLAVFMAMLLFYFLRTARDISEIVQMIKKESERFVSGVSSARHNMKGRGVLGILQTIFALVQSFSGSSKKDTFERRKEKSK
ncbi:MAG: hypothetical protein Q7K40_05085 [bacterium]|nr:hypothetical protein [bacterium]